MGGLTNRQLNTYPSFYLNTTQVATKTQIYQNIEDVLVHVLPRYRHECLFFVELFGTKFVLDSIDKMNVR